VRISGVTGATGPAGIGVTGPQGPTGVTGPSNVTAKAQAPIVSAGGATPDAKMAAQLHNKDLARDFLTGLDPTAGRFTFQFFRDGPGHYAEIFHGTLDEVWPKVQALNTPEGGVGVFVTINQTDFTGRSSKNIVRARALFADADSDEQITGSMAVIEACGAAPSMIVKSGRGLHFYYVCSDIPRDQFSTLQKRLIDKLGTDAAITDLPRVMRLPGTLHLKDPTQPWLVELVQTNGSIRRWNLSELAEKLKLSSAGAITKEDDIFNPTLIERERIQSSFAHLPAVSLSAGLETNIEEIRSAVLAIPPSAISTEPEWMKLARALAHEAALFEKQTETLWEILDTASRRAPGYNQEDNRRRFERYIAEVPNCDNPITLGTVFHLAKEHGWQGWSPPFVTPANTEPSFVDPYAEFAGPEFPMDVLPPTLADFVAAQHQAMGADPSALAMSVLTAVAGAIHAETLVRAGEGWWERPILWTFLIGPPSAMKSPIIDKTTKPLSRIDYERSKNWQQEYATWQQANKQQEGIKTPPPPKPARCIINDATAEKVAEFLSRSPCGSLMVHDELAGFIGSFERYSLGASSRAFHLQSWNGGPFNKDRVGKGKADLDAEIRVENLALCILGGIQPDRLMTLGDLTSDGLLQRALPCLMKSAERGNEYYPVARVESDYERLINSVNSAPPEKYHFDQDALQVRDRVNDYLHELEQVDGFSSALIGAIGKLRGYFPRICLVLEVARANDQNTIELSDGFEHCPDGFEHCPDAKSLGAGLNPAISRSTAEAAEKILRQFLLPHIFGLYDIVVNGGQDRDMLRSIGDFILASPKDRLRPSDLTSGVRALRGEPEQKIREWAGRFCAMGWLQPEEVRPGVPPKAWLVVPGLREHFAERRKQAQAARAKAHEIMKAGGSRKSHDL
jgi:Protein of unknown function (DUF3987)/Primase C terminal 2 (PriCT-2)/RepB DNA-primase from phage plasmid